MTLELPEQSNPLPSQAPAATQRSKAVYALNLGLWLLLLVSVVLVVPYAYKTLVRPDISPANVQRPYHGDALSASVTRELPPAVTDPDLTNPQRVDNEEELVKIFTPPANVNQLLVTSENDQPLDHEPANLQPHPQGRRLGGITRIEGASIQEYSFWVIDNQSLDDITTFYLTTARKQGFKLASQNTTQQLPSTDQPEKMAGDTAAAPTASAAMVQPQTTRTLTLSAVEIDKENAGKQAVHPLSRLIVRMKPATDGQVHVTLWYSYPVSGR